MWRRRPMSPQLLHYAAEDVSQLLALADKLTAELSSGELRLLPQLSKANGQCQWEPADRDGAQASRSYR